MEKFVFQLPSSPSQKRRRSFTPDDQNNERSFLWADQHAPSSIKQICVPTKKVEELRDAIEYSSISSNQGFAKIILLSGKAGIGKSTLVQLLCKSLNYDILEWINPTNDYDPGQPHESRMTLFTKFLESSIIRRSRRQIIFVDDMPDITTEDIKLQLHSALKSLVNSPANFLLIMVATDAWMETSSSSYNNYDNRLNRHIDIIPMELNNDLRVKHIRFNPVTIAKTKKILETIAREEQKLVTKEQIDQIVEQSDGDIRAAINNLQFACVHSARSRRKLSPKKKSTDKAPFDDKTGPLTLFHAVGKVLYAKRNPSGTYESKPEHILAKLPVDTDMFISYLHHNYSEFFTDIDYCDKLLGYISDADTIRSRHDWQDTNASMYRGLVSINGIMINPPRASLTYRLQRFEKPQFYQAQLETRQHKLEKSREEFMASVRARTDDYEAKTQMDYEDDPVKDFSEDEFDDFYGDDDELAEFMNY